MTSHSPISTHNQSKYHQFHVRCLSTKKTLTGKNYQSVGEIKQDAFNLYDNVSFNENNTILTYLDDNHKHLLLTAVPDLPKKGHYQDLFLRFVCISSCHQRRLDLNSLDSDSSCLRNVLTFVWYS